MLNINTPMKLTVNILKIIGIMVSINCHSQHMLYSQQGQLSRAEIADHLRTYIEKVMSKNKIAGLSIAVVDSNGVLLADGFGMADKEKKIAANSATLFPIGSVTKTFTGIAIMQLVEKELIELDKPVGDYIPELSLPNGEERIITTRMLLTHHSGIHGDILYNWYLPSVSKDPLIYEQVIDLINNAGTIHSPGKLHSYCNAGYALLGVLIHKVSGMGYVDYIRTHVFEPLGMDNSIVFAGEPTDNFIAKGYLGKDSTSMPMKLGIPAGGIAMTATDAAKYLSGVIGSWHGDNRLLKQETVKMMMTQQNAHIALDQGFSMGLTWFLQNPLMKHTKYAAHRGELPPYHSMMVLLPEIRCGVFVSVNTNKAASVPDELAHKIIRDLYAYHTGKALPETETKAVISLIPEQLKLYEGIYPNVYFGPMTVKLKSRHLVVKTPAMPVSLVLTPHAGNTFTMQARLLGIRFSVKMLQAMQVEFRENQGEKFMYFNIQNSMLNPNLKTEPFEIPHEYSNYEGKYQVVNMQNSDRVVKDVKIKKKGKFSMLSYTFLGRHQFNMVIEPLDKQSARFAGTGYFVGDKLRWENQDGKIVMYWSGLVLEKK